jgi:uncharacterized membrane protein YcgQ (UPF0703/DUF1980 family)
MNSVDTPDSAPDPQDQPHTHDHGSCGHGCGHDHGNHQPQAHQHAEDDCGYQSSEQRFFFGFELLALIVWGSILIYFVASGRVVYFLTATGIFREQALIGGLALLVLAVFNFAMRNRFPGCGHHHDEAGHEHHEHETDSWVSRTVTLFLLLVPAGLAAAKAPDDWTDAYKSTLANSLVATNAPQGASSLAGQFKPEADQANGKPKEFTLEDFKRYSPPTPEGYFQMSAFNLWSLAGDPDFRKVLAGQLVEATAQIVEDKATGGPNSNRLRMFDLQMTCCAADSRPVSFPIVFPEGKPQYREMGWYKVRGKINFEALSSGKSTVIEVQEMIPSTKPNPDQPAI